MSWDDQKREQVKRVLETKSDTFLFLAMKVCDPKLIQAWEMLADSDETPERIGEIIGQESGNPDWGTLTARMVRYLRQKEKGDEQDE